MTSKSKLLAELDEARSQADCLQTSVKSTQGRLSKVEEDLQNTIQENAKQERGRRKLEREKLRLKREVADLQTELEGKKETEKSNRSLERDLKKMRSQLIAAEQEIINIQSQRDSLQQTLRLEISEKEALLSDRNSQERRATLSEHRVRELEASSKTASLESSNDPHSFVMRSSLDHPIVSDGSPSSISLSPRSPRRASTPRNSFTRDPTNIESVMEESRGDGSPISINRKSLLSPLSPSKESWEQPLTTVRVDPSSSSFRTDLKVVSQLKAMNEEANQRLLSSYQTNNELLSSKETLEREVNQLRVQLKDLNLLYDSLRSRFDDSRLEKGSEVRDLRRQLDSTQKQMSQLQSQLKGQQQSQLVEIKQLQSLVQSGESRIKSLQEQQELTEDSKSSLQRLLQSLSSENQQLKDFISSFSTEKKKLLMTTRSLQSQLESASQENQQQLDSLKRQLDEKSSLVSRLSDQLSALEDTHTQVGVQTQTQLDHLLSQLQLVGRSRDETVSLLSKQLLDSQEQLEEKRRTHLSIADQLESLQNDHRRVLFLLEKEKQKNEALTDDLEGSRSRDSDFAKRMLEINIDNARVKCSLQETESRLERVEDNNRSLQLQIEELEETIEKLEIELRHSQEVTKLLEGEKRLLELHNVETEDRLSLTYERIHQEIDTSLLELFDQMGKEAERRQSILVTRNQLERQNIGLSMS